MELLVVEVDELELDVLEVELDELELDVLDVEDEELDELELVEEVLEDEDELELDVVVVEVDVPTTVAHHIEPSCTYNLEAFTSMYQSPAMGVGLVGLICLVLTL